MEITILNEKVNPLLQRREFQIDILHPSSPSPKRAEVRKEFCVVKSAPADRMVIEWVRAMYGAPRSRGLVHVYDNVDALKKTARHHILKRNGLIKEEKKDDKAAAPTETPAAAPAPPPAKKEKEATPTVPAETPAAASPPHPAKKEKEPKAAAPADKPAKKE